MIALMIVLALCNGFLVILTRLINSRLGRDIGAPGASVWNHLTGMAVMLILLTVPANRELQLYGIPVWAYIGGFIGAGYVTLSNLLIPRIGASKATVLMIAGQISTAGVIDYFRGFINRPLMAAAGVVLIITGVYLGEYGKPRKNDESA